MPPCKKDIVVDEDILNRVCDHTQEATDLLREMLDEERSCPTPDIDAARKVVSKHHRTLFLNNGNQHPPGEDDQQYLDDLTESLLEQLFPPQ